MAIRALLREILSHAKAQSSPRKTRSIRYLSQLLICIVIEKKTPKLSFRRFCKILAGDVLSNIRAVTSADSQNFIPCAVDFTIKHSIICFEFSETASRSTGNIRRLVEEI